MGIPSLTHNLGHASALRDDPFRLRPGSKWHRYMPTRNGPGHAQCNASIRPVGDDVQWAVETPRRDLCRNCFEGLLLELRAAGEAS